jgi:nitroreductase
MFNDTSSPLSLLHSRRSGKPRDMVEPGPSDAQLEAALRAAIRVPDHGKIAPWRFIIIGKDQRTALADLIVAAYRSEKPDAGKLEIDSMIQFAHQAPSLVVVLSAPVQASKIPLWEQQLSAGAACMNLLNAVHAQGFVGGWLTAWPAFNDTVRNAFGGPEDRIAGFIFIGSPAKPLEERPRPDFDAVVTHWNG